MACKRWNGSAYVDLVPAKFGNNVPDLVQYWNGTRYALLWPDPTQIFDNFNRTATTGAIGPLWNKMGAGSEIASQSFDCRTTDGAYGIYSVGSISGDNGFVQCLSDGPSAPRTDRYSYIFGRIADDGLSGIYLEFSTSTTEIGTYSGSLDNTSNYAGWLAKLTPGGSGGGVAQGETVRMTYIDNTITVTKGATTLINTSLSYRKGKGYRRGGAMVTRTSFFNSGSLDDLTIQDIDY